jgi:hypothetical protein
MEKIAFALLAAALVFLPTLGLGATINLKATWTNPTTNTDGSQLTDLAGFNLYRTDGTRTKINTSLIPATIGTSSSPYLFVEAPTASCTMTFVVTAMDSAGTESADSNTASYVYTPTPPPTVTPSAPSKLLIILSQ